MLIDFFHVDLNIF